MSIFLISLQILRISVEYSKKALFYIKCPNLSCSLISRLYGAFSSGRSEARGLGCPSHSQTSPGGNLAQQSVQTLLLHKKIITYQVGLEPTSRIQKRPGCLPLWAPELGTFSTFTTTSLYRISKKWRKTGVFRTHFPILGRADSHGKNPGKMGKIPIFHTPLKVGSLSEQHFTPRPFSAAAPA